MRRLLRHVFLFVFFAWANVAVAQGAPGGLTGKLVDPNGHTVTGLVNVIVIMKAPDGKVFTGMVKATGEYSVTGLPAGTYDLSIPMQCCMYRTFEQKSVAIKAGETLRNDIAIAWGGLLGTIGDDPGMLGNDLRARTKNTGAPPPRTADGHPDLTGIWYDLPPSGPPIPPPMKPWAEEMFKKMKRPNDVGENGAPGEQLPQAYCLPAAAIPTTLSVPFEFVQTPTRIVQITELTTPGHRQIYMDGRPHPDPNEWNPAWYGHSIGHWDGDTLVIDTAGFNEITPGFGIHSEKLHTVERIRRPTRGQLIIDITAEDPEAWTGPYVTHYVAGLVENQEILEYVCAENNSDVLHFGGKVWTGRP